MHLHRQGKLGGNNFRSKDNDVQTVVAVLLERATPFQTWWTQGNLQTTQGLLHR